MKDDEKEKKNKKIGMAVSLGFHALLALLFFFIMAWREPNPPLPEYGIQLNFGVDEAGSGDIQPETQPTEQTEEIEESQPEETQQEVMQEEVSEPVEEVVEEETAVTTQESPVTVPKVTEEKKVEKPKEEKKEPVKAPVKTKPVEEKKEERKVETAYPSKNTSKDASVPSQGDKTGTGDQGDPKGDLDERALYGKQGGGGGGSSFSLEGWNWDWIPKPEDTSNESGRIVFQIKVNADGEILSVTTIERSVSPAIEKIYRAEVEKLTFSRKSSTGTVPPVSTGTITFVIKSK